MAHLFEHTAPASTESFIEKSRRFWATYAKYHSDRRTYGRILIMSNRQLIDIGLTRDDVREAMTQTFSQPGAH
jgi:uncharacterized protein YjiS (DUF1127 family)